MKRGKKKCVLGMSVIFAYGRLLPGCLLKLVKLFNRPKKKIVILSTYSFSEVMEKA